MMSNDKEILLLCYQKECENNLQQLKLFKEKFEYQKLEIISAFDNALVLICRQINKLTHIKNYIQDILMNAYLQSKMKFQLTQCQDIDFFENLKNELKQQYEQIQINLKLQKLQDFLKEFSESQILKQNQKEYDYKLLSEIYYQQFDWCLAFTFNYDNSILITTCKEKIKAFKLKCEKFQEIQVLLGHIKDVYCLEFFKKSNDFISASVDSKIIIWDQYINFKWRTKQILQGHQQTIYCIALNQFEDLIISGSMDQTIKFWSNLPQFWTQKQSVECDSRVFSLSLSSFSDNLIAALENLQIIVFKIEKRSWIINQIISVKQYGYRLCYINSNQFVFQPLNSNYFEIYQNTKADFLSSFEKSGEIYYPRTAEDGNCLFPIRFIQQKGILLIKNQHFVNIIKVDQIRNKFFIKKSINFETTVIYGNMSDDGKYLVTWDKNTREIQVRKDYE